MEMKERLDEDIFEIVKQGSKHIEVRLYDEKRRKLNVGDTIIFVKRDNEIKKRYAIVKELRTYNNFEELVKNYDIKDMYLDNYAKEDFIKLLERFYTKEQQEQYGVLAIDFEIKEKSCGAAIIKNDKILLVKHNLGHWGMPKGHVEENETEQETAIREVKEETNIDIKILDGFRTMITYSPKLNTKKDVVFFIGEPISNEIIKHDCEVSEAKYVSFDDAINLVEHNDERNVILEVRKFLDY